VFVRVHRLLRAQRPPTSWMHRLEMTSFTFMFDCVPDPVWNTYNGNSASSAPEITSSQTRSISSRFQACSRPAAGRSPGYD
jgi:hypothetical protein